MLMMMMTMMMKKLMIMMMMKTFQIFLAGLQSNSGLWIDDVRLSICLSVNILVNLCV